LSFLNMFVRAFNIKLYLMYWFLIYIYYRNREIKLKSL
jgi:hypothetical protein